MTDQHRGIIPPVPAGTSRPLWSVMIPTYNCANFLEETLVSVLANDPGPDLMQIEVVDDHSTTDDPLEVVQRIGRGRVDFFRQAENVGHARNFNSCIQRSRGRLVHILHGDDRVREGFYRRMAAAFENDPEIGAAFCRVWVIDEAGTVRYEMPALQPNPGRVADGVRTMAVRQPVETPAIVVRRDVYERLGGFDQRLKFCGEDLEMWVRISAHYPIWYEVEPLALYRTHARSLSGTSVRTGQNIRDVRFAIDTFSAYIPQEEADDIAARARTVVGVWAIDIAREAVSRNDFAAARSQVREALHCSRSAPVMSALARLVFGTVRQKARRALRRVRNLPSRLR